MKGREDPWITVVVTAWREAPWLGQCLQALAAQRFRPFEVLVVWNEGPDGWRPPPGLPFPLRIHRNPHNVGFAAAVNQGLRMARGRYLAVLNDDAFPEPGWLEALEAAMGEEAIGACASLMVFHHRPGIVQSAGIAIDRAAIAWDRWRGRPVAEALQPGEVFGACAGAALYRRALLETVGGFDERFFAYLEDVDLAWRAQTAGWRCVYVPEARVRHRTSAAFQEGSPRKQRLLGRNKVWLVIKNAPLEDWPLILAYDLMAVLYAWIWRRDPNPLRGRLEGWRGIKPFLADRRPGRPRCFEPLVPPWQVPARFAQWL